MLTSKTSSSPNPLPASTRHVNHLLHTLRGEQFRHLQNLRQSRSHLTAFPSHLERNGPTLPLDVTSSLGELDASFTSWIPPRGTQVKSQVFDTPAERANALSLLFSHRPSASGYPVSLVVPSLVLLCVKVLLKAYALEDLVHHLPGPIQVLLARYVAVYYARPIPELSQLYSEAGGGSADGEIILVGPHESLLSDLLDMNQTATDAIIQDDWDSPPESQRHTAPPIIRSLILLSTPLSVPSLIRIPRTLTHLALLNLHSTIPIHRIPDLCPLLTFLDLSYNVWVGDTKALTRVRWERWTVLEVVGLRECMVDKSIVQVVNSGRWNEVCVIL